MYKFVEMHLDKAAKGRSGQKIVPKGVVIHWTANTAESADADNNRNYFNYSGVSASAHYVVDEHQIVQCLPEDEMAYHVGAKRYSEKALRELSWYPNNCSLGVEICVNKGANFKSTMLNAVSLCADICIRHKWTAERLWRHFDITGKDCPKFFVDDATASLYGFTSAEEGWKNFKADVDKAISGKQREQSTGAAEWKLRIVREAQGLGLIQDEHHPDDPAPKWFVLQVALNVLKVLQQECEQQEKQKQDKVPGQG